MDEQHSYLKSAGPVMFKVQDSRQVRKSTDERERGKENWTEIIQRLNILRLRGSFPPCVRSLFSAASGSGTVDELVGLIKNSCRYQLAVTQRKEEEPSSTSIYNLNDPWTPTVDFTDFINNETIAGQVSCMEW